MKKVFFSLMVILAVFHLNAKNAFYPNQNSTCNCTDDNYGTSQKIWDSELLCNATVGATIEVAMNSSVTIAPVVGARFSLGFQPYIVENVLHVKGATQIEVVDLTGKTLITVTDNDNVDVTFMKRGIYLVRAVVNGQACAAKIVKK